MSQYNQQPDGRYAYQNAPHLNRESLQQRHPQYGQSYPQTQPGHVDGVPTYRVPGNHVQPAASGHPQHQLPSWPQSYGSTPQYYTAHASQQPITHNGSMNADRSVASQYAGSSPQISWQNTPFLSQYQGTAFIRQPFSHGQSYQHQPPQSNSIPGTHYAHPPAQSLQAQPSAQQYQAYPQAQQPLQFHNYNHFTANHDSVASQSASRQITSVIPAARGTERSTMAPATSGRIGENHNTAHKTAGKQEPDAKRRKSNDGSVLVDKSLNTVNEIQQSSDMRLPSSAVRAQQSSGPPSSTVKVQQSGHLRQSPSIAKAQQRSDTRLQSSAVKTQQSSDIRSPLNISKAQHSNDSRQPSSAAKAQHSSDTRPPQSTVKNQQGNHTNQPQSTSKAQQSSDTRSPMNINKLQQSSHTHPRSSSPLTQLRTSQMPPPPSPEAEDDTHSTLLGLADEYTSAAHSMAHSLVDAAESDIKHYQRLVGAAIGCLEAALDLRQPTIRQRGRIRLKLASLLLQETEDIVRATEILTQGLAECRSARLMDLKCTMCYLLVECAAKNATRLTIIDRLILDSDSHKALHWRYASRLLKLSVYLNMDTAPSTIVSLLTQTKALSSGGPEIMSLLSCLEAIVHLRTCTSEGLESARTAMATVHSYQESLALPQLRALSSILRLACYLPIDHADQMEAALLPMQQENEALCRVPGWTEDGSLIVNLGIKPSDHLIDDTAGIFAMTGHDLGIKMDWLNRTNMLSLCYCLSGVALHPRNGESRKAEAFLRDALKINDSLNAQSSCFKGASLNTIFAMQVQQQLVSKNIRLLLASVLVAKAHYDDAMTILRQIKTDNPGIGNDVIQARISLLTAMCAQGNGDVVKALDLYTPWLKAESEDRKMPHIVQDIQALARLSSIHIMKRLGIESHIERLMDSVEEHCLKNNNAAFASAYSMIRYTLSPPETTITQMKADLNKALSPASALKNKQLLTIIMSTMTNMWFADTVGEQSRKSANAARTLAHQTGDPLWIAIGCGLLRDTLKRSLNEGEAAKANSDARSQVEKIPRAVRSALELL